VTPRIRWAFASGVLVPRGTWGRQPARSERRKVFQWAKRTGFSGIELSPRWVDFDGMTGPELRELRADAADEGLSFSGLNLSRCILTRTAQAGEHRQRLQRSVSVAETLGTEVINISLSMPTLAGPERSLLLGHDVSDSEYEQSVELVARAAEAARQAGISLSLELHDDGLLDSPELCLQFLEKVGAPNVGVNPDLGNLCRGPTLLSDWKTALILLAPRTVWWHVKNYRDGRSVPLWDGDIDYYWALLIMRGIGYEGWVSIESYRGGLESQEQDLHYLKRLEVISAGVRATR
jgi:sugar phosphate isomerase/epimerase